MNHIPTIFMMMMMITMMTYYLHDDDYDDDLLSILFNYFLCSRKMFESFWNESHLLYLIV